VALLERFLNYLCKEILDSWTTRDPQDGEVPVQAGAGGEEGEAGGGAGACAT